MDWILLDNKPFKNITEQQGEMYKKMDELIKKVNDLEKQNQNLENFLIHNQKLYLKHFNIICDILQENRSLYMKQMQSGNEEIESLKPILRDIERHSHQEPQREPSPELRARYDNLVWRSQCKSYLTTPKVNDNLIKQVKEH